MAGHVCPFWIGYFLINPLRKLFENPYKLLGRFIKEGMTILEPGCGMGYFTLPLARMTGAKGKVIAVDIQPKMLSSLNRRAKKAGLIERIDVRLAKEDNSELNDLFEKVDFVCAIHMIHEVKDQIDFFSSIWKVLKLNSKLFVIEPKGHVNIERFERSIEIAKDIGFQIDSSFSQMEKRRALLVKI